MFSPLIPSSQTQTHLYSFTVIINPHLSIINVCVCVCVCVCPFEPFLLPCLCQTWLFLWNSSHILPAALSNVLKLPVEKLVICTWAFFASGLSASFPIMVRSSLPSSLKTALNTFVWNLPFLYSMIHGITFTANWQKADDWSFILDIFEPKIEL